jgi:hypothetical protein
MKNTQKFNTEEAKQLFMKKELIPLFNIYNHSKEKLLCMNKSGYKAQISYNGLQQNKFPRWFSKDNPYTIENIQMYISNNNLESKIISDIYVDNTSNLIFECKKCGKLYTTSWNTFQDRKLSYCQECVKANFFDNRRHNIEYIKSEYVKQGYTPMFRIYTNNHEKLLVKNIDGYMGFLSYHNLKIGQTFEVFHKLNSYTIQNINLYIKTNGLNCKLLETRYISNSTKMKFQCECGEIFETQWDTFCASKTRCDMCTKRKSVGEYKVELWLNEHKVPFKSQYRICECKYKSTLPFDICVFPDTKNQILIEVNGIQHYQPVEHFGGEEKYNERQKLDNIKEQFCRDKNIQLIKISYKDLENNSYIDILRKELNSV